MVPDFHAALCASRMEVCVKMSETTPWTNLVYEGIEETVWLPVTPP
jgi:hypothetical protein